MWLFTVHGFFSVVGTADGRVAIRARDKQHLEALLKRTMFRVPIEQSALRDYCYRVHVTKQEWRVIALDLSSDVFEVDNFKSECERRKLPAKYLQALHDVWGYMESAYRVNKNRKRR